MELQMTTKEFLVIKVTDVSNEPGCTGHNLHRSSELQTSAGPEMATQSE